MKNISKFDIRLLAIAGGLIVFGFAMRAVPHVPNFSPMIGIALFSGYYFRSSILSWLVPFVTVVVSDLHIGFYNIMPIVWLSYIAMSLLTRKFMRRGSFSESIVVSIGGAILFYIVTNFAVWAQGEMYSMNLKGLVECYTAAIPFFRNTLMSAVVYTPLLVMMGRAQPMASGIARK